MKRWGINARVLLLALVPAITIALLLGFYLTHVRFADLERALNERGLAIARQLAPATEYGVFSGNREVLDTLVVAVSREADVKAVVIRDGDGHVLARGGTDTAFSAFGDAGEPPRQTQEDGGRILVSSAPIFQSQVVLEEFYNTAQSDPPFGQPHAAKVLGRVHVALSRDGLIGQRHRLIFDTLVITLLIVGAGTILALRMGRDITRPVVKLTDAVQKLAQGDLDARVVPDSVGVIRALEDGVNTMAARLHESYAGLEQKVAERTEELVAANRAKSRFLAVASHDLRQPMHALGLFVTQLNNRIKDPENRHLTGRIEAAVSALQGLLDALLDVSRLDAGVVTVNLSDFRVNALLERIETAFAPDATDRGLRFRVARCRLAVHSDPMLLERILINLVANALRYSEVGGILVGCRRRGERVRIEVWDTGVGIASEHQQAIFEEFYQVGNPERDRQKGLGLGLSIAARLARLLGGRIDVHSVPGRGTVFAVEVLRGEEIHAAAAVRAPADFDDRLQGAFVLVVDDDALVCEALAGLMEQWGCTVVTAASGDQALAALAKQPRTPDAVLCDYRLLAGETGSDVIRRLRERHGTDLPAALITGDTAPERLHEAQENGIPLLHKPVQPARLRALLEHLVAAP